MKIRFAGMITFFLLTIAIPSCGILPSGKEKPNIVIILTDDLDFRLMRYLKNTDALIAQKGAVFTNYFVTSPLCCPSRTSMFRGQYPHNTNVMENTPGFKRFFDRKEETETLAVWLKRAGYNTGLMGKYLNLYPSGAGRHYVPPGWTDWHAFVFEDPQKTFYYDYKMNENGEVIQYGNSAQDYSTDVIGRHAIDFINKSIADRSPFFILISTTAPHGPSVSAPRHAEMFQGLEYPQSISFNEKDMGDKPFIIRSLTTTGDVFDVYDANSLFIKRVQSTQAVDELVAEVVHLLEGSGQMDNTYVIFTSDNGFHMGEHGISAGKGLPYEEDIHVPFMIRGPGIKPNTEITQMVTNIDIAPTIAEMTGARTAEFVDGRSAMTLLFPQNNQTLKWRKGFLIEMGYGDTPQSSVIQQVSFFNSDPPFGLKDPDAYYDRSTSRIEDVSFRGIRTEKFVYVEYVNGEIEYYDLTADPFELNNLAKSLDASVLASLHSWLEELKTCSAEACRKSEDTLPASLEK